MKFVRESIKKGLGTTGGKCNENKKRDIEETMKT